jgi:hypothetical protein
MCIVVVLVMLPRHYRLLIVKAVCCASFDEVVARGWGGGRRYGGNRCGERSVCVIAGVYVEDVLWRCCLVMVWHCQSGIWGLVAPLRCDREAN